MPSDGSIRYSGLLWSKFQDQTTIQHLSPKAQLNFVQNAINKDTITAFAMLEEKRRYWNDIGIGRHSKLQCQYLT